MTMLKMLLPLFLFWSSGISLVSTPDVISFSYTVGEWKTVAPKSCMDGSIDITGKPIKTYSPGTVLCVVDDQITEYFIAVSKQEKQGFAGNKPSYGFMKFTVSDSEPNDYKNNLTMNLTNGYGRPGDTEYYNNYKNNISNGSYYNLGTFIEHEGKLYEALDGMGLRKDEPNDFPRNANPSSSNSGWGLVKPQYSSWERFKDSGKIEEKHAIVKHKGYWYTTAHVNKEINGNGELKKRAWFEPGTEKSEGYWNRVGDIRYQKYNIYSNTLLDILVFDFENGDQYVGSIKSYCMEYEKGTAGFDFIKECK